MKGIIIMKISEAFSTRLKYLIEYDKKTNVFCLSSKIGLSRNAMYNLVNQKYKDVHLSTIEEICNGLGISLKEFFDSPLFEPESELYYKAIEHTFEPQT